MKALTGLQIFKYLPGGKKEKEANCKKCGFATCMAFAMKLAKKETNIAKCEYASEEIKDLLSSANQVQQAEIKFGIPDNQIITGNETVMFRHDKTFVNKTCIAIELKSSDSDFDAKLEKISNFSIERVGETLHLSAILLKDTDNTFIQKAMEIADKSFPLILQSENIDNIKEILEKIPNNVPLVYLSNNNVDQIAEIQKYFKVPTVITANNKESLIKTSEELLNKKCENIVLKPANLTTKNVLEELTLIRRAAIENKFKPLGFPVISFLNDIKGISKDNNIEKNIWASALMCKYSNIIVIDYFDEALLYSLLTLRQNIYTDPQKPLQIEPKVYPIGDVTKDSPVLVTTNFALTYFTVAGEIEASGIPAYLVITPSDGMSVLTAWAASKFSGEIISKALKEFDIASLVNHKTIIIPGLTAILKDEIEEELPGWQVIIGTNESVDISEHLKSLYKN